MAEVSKHTRRWLQLSLVFLLIGALACVVTFRTKSIHKQIERRRVEQSQPKLEDDPEPEQLPGRRPF